MSFQAMAAVIPLRLPTGEKFVLLMLANYADQDWKCWPSIGRLAADTGMSESTVRRALSTLRDYSGLIAVQQRLDSDGRQTSNNYLLDIELCLRMKGGEGVMVTGGGVSEIGGRVSVGQGEGVTVTPEPINEPVNKEPTTKRASALSVSSLPDWVPKDAWQQWCAHKGKKLTPLAKEKQIAKLRALREQGCDLVAVIDAAIESGWATFYPPREVKRLPSGGRLSREDLAAQLCGRSPARAEVIDIYPEVSHVAA